MSINLIVVLIPLFSVHLKTILPGAERKEVRMWQAIPPEITSVLMSDPLTNAPVIATMAAIRREETDTANSPIFNHNLRGITTGTGLRNLGSRCSSRRAGHCHV